MYDTKIIVIVGEHYSGKHYFQNLVSKKHPNIQPITIYDDFIEFIRKQNANQLNITLSDQIYTLIAPADIDDYTLITNISELQHALGAYNISIVHMIPDTIPMMQHALNNKNLPDHDKINLTRNSKNPGTNAYTQGMEYLTVCIKNTFDKKADDHMYDIIEELYDRYKNPIYYNTQKMAKYLTTIHDIVHICSQDENIFHENIPDTVKTVYYNTYTHIWQEITKDIIPIPTIFEYITFHKFMDDVIKILNKSEDISTRYVNRDPNVIYLNTGERYDITTKITAPPDASAPIGCPIHINKIPYDVSVLTTEERKIFDYVQNMFGTSNKTGTNITKTIIKSLMCPAESAGMQIIINYTTEKEEKACKLFFEIIDHIIWYRITEYTGTGHTAWVYDDEEDHIVETSVIKADNVLTPLRYNQIILRFIQGPVTVINPKNNMYGIFVPAKLPKYKEPSENNIKHIAEQLAAWVMENPEIDQNTGNAIGFKDLIQ